MATILGIFNNGIDLERALFELDSSLARDEILVVDREHDYSPEPGQWIGFDNDLSAEWLEQDIRLLESLGVESSNAAIYAEAIQRRGLKLLIVEASDRGMLDICEAMDRCDSQLIAACETRR